jgi:hypothetical protein
MPVYGQAPAYVQSWAEIYDAIDDEFPEAFDPSELERDAEYDREYCEWAEEHESPVTEAELDAMAAAYEVRS